MVRISNFLSSIGSVSRKPGFETKQFVFATEVCLKGQGHLLMSFLFRFYDKWILLLRDSTVFSVVVGLVRLFFLLHEIAVFMLQMTVFLLRLWVWHDDSFIQDYFSIVVITDF